MVYFFFLIQFVGANTFQLEGSKNDFKLVIDARKVSYTSEEKGVYVSLRDCNLSLARALNAELLDLVPRQESKDGNIFKVDGNTYRVSSAENGELLKMDKKMDLFKASGDKACD